MASNPAGPSNYPREHKETPRPWWVEISLIGLSSRRSVLSFGWLSIVLAAASVALVTVTPIALLGVGFLLAAWPYFATVAWMDRHNGWN